MKKLLLIFLLLAGLKANTQTEVAVQTSSTFFLGDLGGTKGEGKKFIFDTNIPSATFSFGGYVTFGSNPKLRIGINSSSIKGSDSVTVSNGTEEMYRKYRNLSFFSKIHEVYGGVEFYPLQANRIKGYVFGGVGVFTFNPKTVYNNKVISLHSLQTENKNYNLTQVMIPIGAGINYYTYDGFFVGAEVLYRKTFTDYIDDVSTVYVDPRSLNSDLSRELYFRGDEIGQPLPAINEKRGNSRNNDSYYTIGIKIGLVIKNKNNHFILKCPQF